MAFNTVTEEDVTTGGFVKSNGVHDVELIRVGLTTRNNGSKGLTLAVKGPNSEYADVLYSFGDTNYAATYTKQDGTRAKMAPRYVDSLAAIVGATDDGTSIVSIEGKDGPVDVEVFTELSGLGVMIKLAVQMQYNDYYKEMKPTVVAVFNEDGFSATELTKKATEANQIKLYEHITDKGGRPATPATASATDIQDANDIF